MPMQAKQKLPLIRTVHVRNYRALRHLDVRLDRPLHVMVGPNGIGKSTLFDAISFVFDLINQGLQHAIEQRTDNFRDLAWQRPDQDSRFEIAIEFQLPETAPFRYEIAVKETRHGVRLTNERAFFGSLSDCAFKRLSESRTLFTVPLPQHLNLIFDRQPPSEESPFQTSFMLEPHESNRVFTVGHGEEPSITMIPVVNQIRTSRNNGSHNTTSFPMAAAATAVRLLQDTIVRIIHLDTRLLTKAAPPNRRGSVILASDGHNLPWVVLNFLDRHPELFGSWLDHLRTALPFLSKLRTSIREDDNRAYLMATYDNSFKLPSWNLSEGTLRLMALTLLAYVPANEPSVYLIEEPENGIHPLAIETVYQALSSAYDSQIIVASHSPTLLRCVDRSELLCFSPDAKGGATVTTGPDHPHLRHWQEAMDNDLVFATHILS